MIGLLGVFVLIFLYNFYKPVEVMPVEKEVIETDRNLTYANAQSYVLKDEETHYLWLCRMDNANCTYVRDYVISPLTEEVSTTAFDVIKFVDFTEAPDTLHYRTSVWGIENIPAFVAVENIGGEMAVLNSLYWNNDSPMTSDMLKTWMHDNGIWPGEWDDSTPIDTPIE